MMGDILSVVLLGLVVLILAPIFGAGFFIIFFHMVLKDKKSSLPTDGAKITPSMLDSKSDLRDLIEDSERFRK